MVERFRSILKSQPSCPELQFSFIVVVVGVDFDRVGLPFFLTNDFTLPPLAFFLIIEIISLHLTFN